MLIRNGKMDFVYNKKIISHKEDGQLNPIYLRLIEFIFNKVFILQDNFSGIDDHNVADILYQDNNMPLEMVGEFSDRKIFHETFLALEKNYSSDIVFNNPSHSYDQRFWANRITESDNIILPLYGDMFSRLLRLIIRDGCLQFVWRNNIVSQFDSPGKLSNEYLSLLQLVLTHFFVPQLSSTLFKPISASKLMHDSFMPQGFEELTSYL